MSPERFAGLMRTTAERLESESFETPLRDCLPVILRGFEDNFMRAEGPDGNPWPARKDNLPHPLLILSGNLIESVRDTGHPGNVHEVEDGGRTLVTGVMTSVVEYAGVHQRGWPERNIPPRTYVYATPQVVDDCEAILASGVKHQIWGDI